MRRIPTIYFHQTLFRNLLFLFLLRLFVYISLLSDVAIFRLFRFWSFADIVAEPEQERSVVSVEKAERRRQEKGKGNRVTCSS
jgi:hypothetical protein